MPCNTRLFKISFGKTNFMGIDCMFLPYGAGEGTYGCLGTGDTKFKKDLTLIKSAKRLKV